MSYQTYVIVKFTEEEDESYEIALNVWLLDETKCRFLSLKKYDNAIKRKLDSPSWKVFDCCVIGQSGKLSV